MRLLAAALVTITILACDLASDVLTMPNNAVAYWHTIAATALVGFAWLVHQDIRGERECDTEENETDG